MSNINIAEKLIFLGADCTLADSVMYLLSYLLEDPHLCVDSAAREAYK
jgi:hypothetical protein